MDSITFEIAQVRDIPEIQALAEKIWYAHYPGIITLGQIEYMLDLMYSNAKIKEEVSEKGFIYLIIRHNGEKVGFTAYKIDAAAKEVYLSKLYVSVGNHGKGIGQAALNHLADIAKENAAKSIFLYVNKKNIKAIKAYETNGFYKEKEIINEIGSGFFMDDYIMRKEM